MSTIDLDPLEIGGSFIGQVIRRVFTFFVTGYLGVLAGAFCSSYSDWGDFLKLPDLSLNSGSTHIFAGIFYWPFLISLAFGYGFFIVFPFFVFALFRMILSDLFPGFTLLLVTILSTMGVVIHEGNYISWILFGFIFTGYSALGFYMSQRFWPEKIERISDVFKFGFGERVFEKIQPPPPKKVGLKPWGENVELDSDEWDDS